MLTAKTKYCSMCHTKLAQNTPWMDKGTEIAPIETIVMITIDALIIPPLAPSGGGHFPMLESCLYMLKSNDRIKL